MHSAVIGFLCALTCAGVATADLGSVVRSWPLTGDPVAVAVSGSEVFVNSQSGSGFIYIYNRTTGSLVRSFVAVGGTYCRGLTYASGGHLWQLYINYPSLYRVYDTNATNGSIYRWWDVNDQYNNGLAALCTGDGGINTTRLITPYNRTTGRRMYYRLLSNGSIANSHSISNSLQDVAYDWRNSIVWGGDPNTTVRTVYGFSTTGSLVATFTSPNSWVRGAGYYGEYLYLAAARFLYVIHCPGNLYVAPSSLGKVKALFR